MAEMAGTWRLDRSRSDAHWFPEPTRMAPSAVAPPEAAMPVAEAGETLVIDRTNEQVTIGRSHRADGPSRSAPLDGVGRTAAEGGTVRAWADGPASVVEVVRSVTLPDGRVVETRTTERFSMQADGTLLHERRNEQGGTGRTWRFVYTRVP
jgi:hypothetical protein